VKRKVFRFSYYKIFCLFSQPNGAQAAGSTQGALGFSGYYATSSIFAAYWDMQGAEHASVIMKTIKGCRRSDSPWQYVSSTKSVGGILSNDGVMSGRNQNWTAILFAVNK
jgi:hypothetical protein